jgi:6-pyruvoyltetrahydropterin/6-carboxytetrahydropterin synthase
MDVAQGARYRDADKAARPPGTQPDRSSMRITQAFTFEAAHRLPNVPETHRCRRMHGHSYRIELRLEGPVDPHTGFVVDFFDVEKAFGPLLARLDHSCLNEIEGLENPTAENIAVWIWQGAKPSLPQLAAVTVYETPQCRAEYEGS